MFVLFMYFLSDIKLDLRFAEVSLIQSADTFHKISGSQDGYHH